MLSTRHIVLVATRVTRISTRSCSALTTHKREAMSVQQPPWKLPVRKAEEPVLRVYNSLTRTKVRLVQPLPTLHSMI